MKKNIYLLLIILLFSLGGCGNNYIKGKHAQKEQKTINIDKIMDKKDIIKNKKEELLESNIKLNNFDLSIVKSAIKLSKVSLCNKINNNIKQKKCKDLVRNNINYIRKGDCDKLLYFKQDCYDEIYYKEKKCDNIKKEILKKECIRKKNLEQAIKNNDISYCLTLPKIKQLECKKKFKK